MGLGWTKTKGILGQASLILFATLLIIISSCENIGPDNGMPGSGDVSLDVTVIDYEVTLSWNDVSNLNSFSVFRKDGSGAFSEIGSNQMASNTYLDNSPPVNTNIQYYVKFSLADGTLIESDLSSVLNISFSGAMVGSVSASNMHYTDKIRISWPSVTDVDSYKVYRYTDTSGSNETTLNASSNILDDSPGTGIPFFYKVAVVKNGVEFTPSNGYAIGIYSSSAIDSTESPENNDSEASAYELGSSSEDFYLFSYNYGEIQDSDWFYTDLSGSLNIEIIVSATDFSNGDLSIQRQGQIPETLTTGTNSLGYTGPFRVYFTSPDPDFDGIGKIIVQIKSAI